MVMTIPRMMILVALYISQFCKHNHRDDDDTINDDDDDCATADDADDDDDAGSMVLVLVRVNRFLVLLATFWPSSHA